MGIKLYDVIYPQRAEPGELVTLTLKWCFEGERAPFTYSIIDLDENTTVWGPITIATGVYDPTFFPDCPQCLEMQVQLPMPARHWHLAVSADGQWKELVIRLLVAEEEKAALGLATIVGIALAARRKR
jgi:hypothetical protein